MNRREVLIGSGLAVAALLPEIVSDTELQDDEIAAAERILERIESGRVSEMFKTKMVMGTSVPDFRDWHADYCANKVTVNVELEWIDPDIIMLRERGVI